MANGLSLVGVTRSPWPALFAALPPRRELGFLVVTLFCLVTHLEFREVLPTAPYSGLRDYRGEEAAGQQWWWREAHRALDCRGAKDRHRWGAANGGLNQSPLRIRQIRGVGRPGSIGTVGCMPRAMERVPVPGNRRGGLSVSHITNKKAAEQAGRRRAERVLLALDGMRGEHYISYLLTPTQHPLDDANASSAWRDNELLLGKPNQPRGLTACRRPPWRRRPSTAATNE